MRSDQDNKMDQSIFSEFDVKHPTCVCGWDSCREFQGAFRELEHPLFDRFVELKLHHENPEHMALKRCIDDDLSVSWKKRKGICCSLSDDDVTRYYIARHHYPEKLLKTAHESKKPWDWTKLLNEDDAKSILGNIGWFIYHGGCDSEANLRVLQAPNVSEANVRQRVEQDMQERNDRLVAELIQEDHDSDLESSFHADGELEYKETYY